VRLELEEKVTLMVIKTVK